MIIYAADDPLVLNGTYDQEGYKPGERARIAKARAKQIKQDIINQRRQTMPPVRRPATPPPQEEGISFGSLGIYGGGYTLPEGDYALEFNVLMHAGFGDNTANRQPRLGVMVTAHPLAGGEAASDHFYSMGTKAHESFAPNPTTGKGLVAIPGGAGGVLNNKTNWYMFLKSLYDSGMGENVLVNDFTVIDGIWVHTQNIPEPEERKGFASTARTGEAQVEQPAAPRLVAVVTEIKEGGKPWEGGGGIPVAGKPAVAKLVPKGASRPAAPAPAAAVTADNEDTLIAATSAITDILEKAPDGVTKLLMRTGVFKGVNTKQGAEMAQAVIEQYFGSDEALNGVLGLLGYKVVGSHVKPA